MSRFLSIEENHSFFDVFSMFRNKHRFHETLLRKHRTVRHVPGQHHRWVGIQNCLIVDVTQTDFECLTNTSMRGIVTMTSSA